MSTRTSSISSLLHRAGNLKYLLLSRNGFCTFHLRSFSGSERSLSSWWSLLAQCMDQLKKSYAKLQDKTASKIPTTESNMERKVTKIQDCPGSPLISESLKPTCRHSDEPAKKPIQCQREPRLKKKMFQIFTCGSSRYHSNFQSTRVFPDKGIARRKLSSLFWNYFSIWVKVALFALGFLLLSFRSINEPSHMQLWQRVTGQVCCNNSATRRENKLDLIYFRCAPCIDIFFD